jgi:TctA family transporter
LLKKGKAHEAVALTLYGSLSAVIILPLISFPSIILIKNFYPLIKQLIPYLLIFISLILISTEKKFNALLVFLLTGTLGFITTTLEFNQPFFLYLLVYLEVLL